MIHEPARLMVVALLAAVQEAGYVAIEKTFRGNRPLTICRLTDRGWDEFENHRKIIRRAL